MIFHACRRDEWTQAVAAGRYEGSSQDRADGFIHFSTAEQMAESVAKHRAGQDDLMLVTADTTKLGKRLRWEPSRGGELFPHVYGALPMASVAGAAPLVLGPDGRHVFPPDWRKDPQGVRPCKPQQSPTERHD